MTKLLAFFFSIMMTTLSGAAVACGIDGGQFYNNIRPFLMETSLPTFYVHFGGSLKDLNLALSGRAVRPDSSGEKEPVFHSVAEALLAKGPKTSYVLGFNQSVRRVQSVHDVRNGQSLTIIYPKGCGNLRVAAQ